MSTPRARSTSRVRFDLDANEAHSPEKARKAAKEERHSDSETTGDRKRRHRRRKHHGEDRPSSTLMNDPYERGARRDDDNNSEGTVELPERFDEHGNRKAGGGESNPLEQILGSLASRFMGGDEQEHSSERDSRSGRRRHRH